MEPQEIEKKFQEQVRRRCQSLECQGYVLVRDKVPTDNKMAANYVNSVGAYLDNLLGLEFGRKEYVIVPNDASGSSHRIYARDIIKYG